MLTDYKYYEITQKDSTTSRTWPSKYYLLPLFWIEIFKEDWKKSITSTVEPLFFLFFFLLFENLYNSTLFFPSTLMLIRVF